MKGNSLLLVAALAATFSLPTQANSQLSLEQRLERLEQQAQTRNQLQAQMSEQIIELQKEVRELRGMVEEHQYKLQQIQERQRELYRDIENRLSTMPAASQQPTADAQSATTTSVVNPSVTQSVKQAVSGEDGRADFEAAFQLVRDKKYNDAIKAFEAFLKAHPQGAYSDNARFWIGQVYFAQSKFAEAEKQFSLMRTEFPNSTKLSGALLKLADIKVRQQKWEEAKSLYEEVANKYTGASQQLARKGLQDLKNKGH